MAYRNWTSIPGVPVRRDIPAKEKYQYSTLEGHYIS